MKTIVISSLIIVALCLFIGKLSITINPFSVKLPAWPSAVGAFLLVIGLIFLEYGAYRRGCDETIEKVIKILDEKQK